MKQLIKKIDRVQMLAIMVITTLLVMIFSVGLVRTIKSINHANRRQQINVSIGLTNNLDMTNLGQMEVSKDKLLPVAGTDLSLANNIAAKQITKEKSYLLIEDVLLPTAGVDMSISPMNTLEVDVESILNQKESVLLPTAGIDASLSAVNIDNNDFVVTPTEDIKKYVSVSYGALNVREKPNTSADVLSTLKVNTEVAITGTIDGSAFVQIRFKENEEEKIGFVSNEYLSDEKIKIQTSPVFNWNGTRLNNRSGVVQGPSGRETFYDLPMGGVLQIMSRYGYSPSEYAIRSDGVCTLRGYVMVAANLAIRPRGSIVQTSLGLGLVCDTGSFTKQHPYGLDIAVKGW